MRGKAGEARTGLSFASLYRQTGLLPRSVCSESEYTPELHDSRVEEVLLDGKDSLLGSSPALWPSPCIAVESSALAEDPTPFNQSALPLYQSKWRDSSFSLNQVFRLALHVQAGIPFLSWFCSWVGPHPLCPIRDSHPFVYRNTYILPPEKGKERDELSSHWRPCVTKANTAIMVPDVPRDLCDRSYEQGRPNLDVTTSRVHQLVQLSDPLTDQGHSSWMGFNWQR